ncbi:MAG: hypothetical protein ONB16_08990 [candidate division KSB1 bacterium]|nr:hypothetical protein [candidate division KSB1 bacterium]MDZ7318103.1 hypothetical protein [candidate division KSB1 bacterium]MDZ7340515.1 hypothetical protein [candidate division KSB1 bacterium]
MMSLFETKSLKELAIGALFIAMILLMCFISEPLGAAPADSVQVIAKHAEADANSIYQIRFSATKPIPPKAMIRITFPPEFDLSEVMIAGSTTINGGFELKVDKQVVMLKRSGLGRPIPPNESVDVKFAIVKNPRRAADDYRISVEILDEAEKTIIKRDEQHKILPQQQ